MLANLQTALDANAIALWLGGLLLALGFRRNRYALIVGVYAIPLFATTATAGILLATALLGLLVTVLPDWEPRGFFGETLFAIRPWSAQVPRAVQCFVDHLREHFAQGFT